MREKPIITANEAVLKINNGDSIMVSGFMGVGSPKGLLKSLKNSDKKEMTLICSDHGLYMGDESEATGVALNIQKKQFKKCIASHIGLNKETQRQLVNNETEVDLVPQGTFAERIRAGGVGLGGFLTPTGVGTAVEEGKEIITIDEKKYLLELPLKADITLIRAAKADKSGNLTYSASARNFSPLMAMAGNIVIVEADEIVEIGALDPEIIVTPGIFVDFLVASNKENN